MAELDAQIGLTADASGVEAGVGRAKKSLASLGASATKMGQDVAGAGDKAGKALSGLGDGGEKSAKKIERDTKSMQSSIQRYIATLEAGSKDSRKYWETMADFKGVDKNALRPLLDQLDRVTAKTRETENAATRLGGSFTALRAAASVAIGSVVVQSAAQAATALYEASVQAERLRIMLDFSSARGSVREIAYLRTITNELGLAFGSTATAYSQFQAAARGTALEGEKSRAVFESIAKASAVMGLSAEQSSGVLLALQQMISKGTVQAEELRGQLGERLPGAFQIAARAMGVTTAELGKMLEQGQVIAEDFLPKFAKALNESLGDSAEKAANRLDAATNRFSTAWERLKQNAGDSGISQFWAGQINILTDGMNDVSNSMDMARLSGSGFIGQMKAGAGAVLAFANPLNAFSYSAQDLGIKLREAEKELDALKRSGAERSSNAMLREAFAHAQRLVDKYREAKAAQNALLGVETEKDPRDQSGFKPRGASYQDYSRQQADSEKALIEVRMRAAGVNKQYLADLKTYQDALRLGTMDTGQYIKAVSELATTTYKSSAAGKEAEKSLKGGASEAKKAAAEYQNLITTINERISAQSQELSQSGKLTESQKIAIKLQEEMASGKVKLTAAQQVEIDGRLQVLSGLEKEVKQRQLALQAFAEQLAIQKELNDDYVAQSKAREAGRQAVSDYARGIDEANDALKYELSLMGLSEQARNVALEQYRIELDLKKQIAAVNKNEGFTQADRDEEVARLTAAAAIAKANAASKVFLDDWKRSVQQYDDIFRQGFADMLNNGKDGWKSFTRSLVTTFKTTVADAIYKMFAQPFVVNIVGNLMGITGGGAGGAALQMASGGGGSSALGLAGNAYSLFGAGGVGGSLMAGAGWLTGATTFGGSLTAGASLLGTGTLAGGAAGLGMIAGAIAPILAGAALLGNVFGLFRKTEKRGYGLMGTLGEEDGIRSLDLMRKGGSLLGGPKWFVRDTGVSEMDKALQDTYKQQRDALIDMGKALGLATAGVENFTVQLGSDELGDKKVRGIRLDGLSDEEAQKKIAEALATANNEIAQQIIGTWERTVREVERIDISRPTDVGDTTDYGVPNVIRESIVDERYIPSEFARDGEQAIDTLTRLATSLTGVNSVFENLGVTLYEASLAGGDMASQLVDLFGGLEQFSQATGTYMQNFYSADEQRDAIRRQLQRAFEGLDLQLPDIDATNAREQFRAIAEAQDLTTESGRETWAALMNLSGAFASVTQEAEDAADAARRLAEEQRRSAIDNAYDLFRRAVDRDRSALQDQAAAISETIGAISSAVDMLKSNARELYGTVDSTAQMQAAQGMVYIENALAGVRAGGSVADYTGLSDAIGAARSGISNGVYTSQFERERDALVLAGQLSEMGDLGELQLSIEERQLKAINEQLEYLDRLSKLADDAVNGTTALTETVQTYFDRLMGLLDPTMGDGESVAKPGSAFAIGGSGPGDTGGSGAFDRDAWVSSIVGQQLQLGSDKGLAHDDPAVLAAINAARYGTGISQADIASAYGVPVDDIERLFAGAGIPKFDVGTNYIQRTGLAVVHEGEAIVPKAFNPWAGGQGMQGGNERLERIVEALTAQNARLEARLAAIEGHAKKQADQFESYSNGGTFSRQKALA